MTTLRRRPDPEHSRAAHPSNGAPLPLRWAVILLAAGLAGAVVGLAAGLGAGIGTGMAVAAGLHGILA